jgi:hypothetical protein
MSSSIAIHPWYVCLFQPPHSITELTTPIRKRLRLWRVSLRTRIAARYSHACLLTLATGIKLAT